MKIFNVVDPEREVQKAQLADSYRQLMQMSAGRHLMEMIDGLKEGALKQIDEKSLENFTASDMGWLKGVRETVSKIKKGVENAINGLS